MSELFYFKHRSFKHMLDFFQESDIRAALKYPQLVSSLQKGFADPGFTPDRTISHYNGMTLLTKPSFDSDYGGIKLITVNPRNVGKSIAPIQGVYYLFDGETGAPRAVFDAKALTNMRTAAASVLAANYLALENSESLLVVGTGHLSADVVTAYCSSFQIKKVRVYGRSLEKAKKVVASLGHVAADIQAVSVLPEAAQDADIISCVTSSTTPLIHGEWLREGQHLDLAGAFTPEMRETDTDAIRKCNVYVDNRSTAFTSGDLYIPLKESMFSERDIVGDLFELSSKTVAGRRRDDQITIFKSVGHALEDLIAAKMVYRYFKKSIE